MRDGVDLVGPSAPSQASRHRPRRGSTRDPLRPSAPEDAQCRRDARGRGPRADAHDGPADQPPRLGGDVHRLRPGDSRILRIPPSVEPLVHADLRPPHDPARGPYALHPPLRAGTPRRGDRDTAGLPPAPRERVLHLGFPHAPREPGDDLPVRAAGGARVEVRDVPVRRAVPGRRTRGALPPDRRDDPPALAGRRGALQPRGVGPLRRARDRHRSAPPRLLEVHRPRAREVRRRERVRARRGGLLRPARPVDRPPRLAHRRGHAGRDRLRPRNDADAGMFLHQPVARGERLPDVPPPARPARHPARKGRGRLEPDPRLGVGRVLRTPLLQRPRTGARGDRSPRGGAVRPCPARARPRHPPGAGRPPAPRPNPRPEDPLPAAERRPAGPDGLL